MKKILFSFAIALLFVSTYMSRSSAQLINPPFGGRVIAILPCTCTGGFAILLGFPRPGFYLFQSGISRLYKNFIILPGSQVLGNAVVTGVCLTALACVPIPTIGTILKVGTSLPGL